MEKIASWFMEIGKIFLIIRHMQPIYLKKRYELLNEQLSKENKDSSKWLFLWKC
ncbi:unknown [Bacillus sp. CAG:988]|nr:unknown [Bacillus sp. CAG:988]